MFTDECLELGFLQPRIEQMDTIEGGFLNQIPDHGHSFLKIRVDSCTFVV